VVPVVELSDPPEEPLDEGGSGVVPETGGLAAIEGVAIVFSLDPDVDAAAGACDAAVSPRGRG